MDIYSEKNMPLVVAPSENGMVLYVFLRKRREVGYVPKRYGPLIVSFDGKQGFWEFLINDMDLLGAASEGTHRFVVSSGDVVQPYFREFADAKERSNVMRPEQMEAAEARIMDEIEKNHNPNLDEALARIREMVAEAVREAEAKEDDERRAGKVLVDNPVARQMAAATPIHWGAIPAGSEYYECISCLNSSKQPVELYLFTGTTRYLESRRQWKAYKPAVELLREYGIWNREGEDPLYGIFHYVPGVMVFITNGDRILAGVRSRNLAGTHVGMVSFPAGLMKPGETLDDAAIRQLKEESGIDFPEFDYDAAEARNPDAPQTTFCFRMATKQREVRETFEAEGKTFVWVNLQDSMMPALKGDVKPLITEFRKQRIELADDVRIAPDAAEGLRQFFGR